MNPLYTQRASNAKIVSMSRHHHCILSSTPRWERWRALCRRKEDHSTERQTRLPEAPKASEPSIQERSSKGLQVSSRSLHVCQQGMYPTSSKVRRLLSCFSQSLDSRVHVANMGPTWVLSAPRWPHEPCYQGCFSPFRHRNGCLQWVQKLSYNYFVPTHVCHC